MYLLLFASSIYLYEMKHSNPVVTDSGQLLPIKMKSIKTATTEEELQQIVKQAKKDGDKLSIAGMQHSQGGQTLYPNAIMLDMKGYNKILAFDEKAKTITVQSGATWDDIQHYINPSGLALKVAQSQNIFTVGGSLSAIGHGRDIRYGSVIDTVESFRLLTPTGEIIEVSRSKNAELFPYVLGGYGLFGVILDMTLTLTDDELYTTDNVTIDYQEYTAFFEEKVLQRDEVKMHMARISVAPDSFLEEMYVTNYELAPNQEDLTEYNKLKGEPLIGLPKFLLGLSRYSDWGKNIFWETQKKYMETTNHKLETRNNVMRSDSKFMEYDSVKQTEVLQEYFVPVHEFSSYIDDLREVLEAEKDFNLLNITIRYVDKSDQSIMSYAKDDMFALVMLINQGRTKQDIEDTGAVIEKMIDVTLAHDGSYYLPYYPYPTREQLHRAYPNAEDFFAMKRKFDPDELFMNMFYEEYGK
ncbi:FAD-binding oxidoreductase [Pseudogracilibacillus auburnensis]|nr:FAD-binding oxidoreductase [Pseudogracilibacillus auburnensis]MBO1002491.1 FAD-binding oxidoreductase [Pseudogracilibacillus auburnensis]